MAPVCFLKRIGVSYGQEHDVDEAVNAAEQTLFSHPRDSAFRFPMIIGELMLDAENERTLFDKKYVAI